MFCTKCGAELAPDASFCTKCGMKVAVSPPLASQQNSKEGYGTMVGGTSIPPVKVCSTCGKSYTSGKHGSLGYEFWWAVLTLIGGIVYYFVRRKERCPYCNSTKYGEKRRSSVRVATLVI